MLVQNYKKNMSYNQYDQQENSLTDPNITENLNKMQIDMLITFEFNRC